MLLRFWIRQLFARRVTRPIRNRPQRPFLEQFERRDLPSTGALQPTLVILNDTPADAPAGVGYTPDQLRTAYGINGITFAGGTIVGDGSGQTIAVVDAYNDPNILGDLDSFDQNVYLSASAKAAGKTLYSQYGAASTILTAFDQNGHLINPASETSVQDAPTYTNWGREISLDVEWAHSLAPGARIDLVECASPLNTNLYAGAVTAGELPGVTAVSMSWGGAEFSGENSYDGDFVHPGVTFLAATGDTGFPGSYPAYSPNVVAVGGTTLNLNSDNTWQSETAWNGSGGGASVYEATPSYQAGVQNTGFRTIPDVSMDALPTGVAIYDSYDYSSSKAWVEVGGTSLSTPCWAALIAVANQGRVASGLSALNTSGPTQTQTVLYNLPSTDFHDITSGSNFGYLAGPGYDEVTGLGSPVAGSLIPDLADAGLISISPGTLPQGQLGVAYGQTITASGGIGNETLTVAGLPAGLGSSASPGQLVISGMPTSAGTFTFTVKATDSAGHSSTQDYYLRITDIITGPLVVTNTSNLASVTGSLPWAVAQADNDGSGDPMVIDFAAGTGQTFATAQTITLASTLNLGNTTAGDSITINGPAAGVILQGGGSSSNFSVVTVAAGATVTINGLTISNGHASGGGGIDNQGTLILNNSTITGNSATLSGGGIFSTGSSRLTATGDTFSNNSAGTSGGGIDAAGTTVVTNCTIAANSAVSGGGIINLGTATLTNCTISGNSGTSLFAGGGLYDARGTAKLTNTIVAGQTTGNNVSGGVSGTNNLLAGNPLLAPLGYYGGPTQTMPLLPGSAAINAGTSGAGIPTTDQRGLGRVGAVDIGAFESQGFSFTAVAGSTPQTSAIETAFANPLAVTLTANNPVEPVNGGVVTFANTTFQGALALLSAPSAVITGGRAAIIAAPDNVVGSYDVVASASGLSASYSLTNVGPVLTSLVVNTTSNALAPGAGLLSLGEAIAFANFDSSGTSTITFDKHVFATPRTITLTGTQLELSNTSETETITGPAVGVTVSGAGLSEVLQVDGGVTASISGLSITGGKSATVGGGVDNAGALSLTNCSVSGDSATGDGGGAYNSGTLSMTNCTISSNSAYAGCGLANNYPGTATLTNCTVSGNSSTGKDTSGGSDASGGGVNNSGSLTMTKCTVSGNSAVFGGGLYNEFGNASLTNCAVSVNTAEGGGGGVFADSFAMTTLTNCTVSGNSTLHPGPFGGGGGVSNGGDSTLTMTNCTVNGNIDNSSGGGGIFNNYGSTATLVNCTVSGNSTSASGGGVLNRGYSFIESFSYTTATTLTNCTVSGNSATNGGGISNQGYLSTLTVGSSNISNNRATSTGGGISTTAGSATITDSILSCNQVNSSGTALGGGIYSANGLLSLKGCTVSANLAKGGAGASGVTGGDAIGGGLDVAVGSTATVTNTLFLNDNACGGAGGSGANGGDAEGGGIAVTGTGSLSLNGGAILFDAADGGAGGTGARGGNGEGGGLFVGSGGTATLTQTTLALNEALGGNGLSGGNGLGGGCYVASGASLGLTDSLITLNDALGGAGKHGGVDGEGIGGGVYYLGTLSPDSDNTILFNSASTRDDNLGP